MKEYVISERAMDTAMASALTETPVALPDRNTFGKSPKSECEPTATALIRYGPPGEGKWHEFG